MSGLRSMQPPVAKPAQLTPMGAMMDMSNGKGADVVSGMASLNVRFAPASVKEDKAKFWAWALADVASTRLTRLRSFMVNRMNPWQIKIQERCGQQDSEER